MTSISTNSPTTVPPPLPMGVSTAPSSIREDRVMMPWGRVSWGPVMMGAICAIGLQFIFTLLGIAIGTSAGEVTTGVDGNEVRTVGMAAGAWWLVTGTIALFVGGLVFGRLSGLPRSVALTLEAAAMWSVVALFGFVVLWSGAGMLTQAASPLAVASASRDPWSTSPSMNRNIGAAERDLRPGTARANETTATDSGSLPTTRTPSNAAAAEEARRATRTASWWSVFGLMAGLAAAVVGGYAGASSAYLPVARSTWGNHTHTTSGPRHESVVS